MDITTEIATQGIALIQIGNSQRFVARHLNLTRSAFRRAYQRYVEIGSFCRRPGTGLHRSETIALSYLYKIRGVVVSEWTVSRTNLQLVQLVASAVRTGASGLEHEPMRVRYFLG